MKNDLKLFKRKVLLSQLDYKILYSKQVILVNM